MQSLMGETPKTALHRFYKLAKNLYNTQHIVEPLEGKTATV
ncbi:hypothetical protein [Moorena producens]|nr:hypothetical protein [Moorena producens]